jgi:hypothetical protein
MITVEVDHTAGHASQDEINSAVDMISESLASFNASLEIAESERLLPARIPGMFLACQSLAELCEQICAFGKVHLQSKTVLPQLMSISSTMRSFDALVMSFSSTSKKNALKGTKIFPFIKGAKRIESKESSEDIVSFREISLFARIIENVFLSRLLLIEVQVDVINKDAITHDEQVNRMEILVK